MIIKIMVFLAFAGILFALFSGVVHLVSRKDSDDKRKTDSDKLFKSLAWRIGISMTLFIFLMISYFAGWIKPEGTLTQLIKQGQDKPEKIIKK